MIRTLVLATFSASLVIVSGCADEECSGPFCGRSTSGSGDQAPTPGGEEPGVEEGKTCANDAKPYIGFGNVNLTGARGEGKGGADRGRTKRYEVLSAEYKRVLGAVPPSMASLGATFGEAKPRFRVEPHSSAVTVSSALVVAFEGCLELTKTAPEYEKAPEASTALAGCTAMARKFWSRVVAPADVQGCVDVAVTDSVKETYATGPDGAPMTTDTTPRRRWAYACSSLLTSTQFLSY